MNDTNDTDSAPQSSRLVPPRTDRPLRIAFVSYAPRVESAAPEDQLQMLRTQNGWARSVTADGGSRARIFQVAQHDGQAQIDAVSYSLCATAGTIRGLRVPRRLHRQVRSWQPDVVHVHGLLYTPQLMALRRVLPRRVAVVVQHHAESPRRHPLGRLERVFLRCADRLLFTGVDTAAPWTRSSSLGSRVAEVMEGSSDFEAEPRTSADRCLDGDPTIVWAGHLDDNKDPETVLLGLARLLDERPRARLYMAFLTAPRLDRVQRLLGRDSRLRDAVELLGKQPYDRMSELYRGADLFVQGSHREGSGLALADALACGAVPVVTDIASFRYMLHGRRDTLRAGFFQAGDVDSCIAALSRVSSSNLNELSVQAQIHFREHLSWPAIGRRARTIYGEALANRRQPMDSPGA